MNDLLYWVWLSLSCTPDRDTFKKLWDKMGDVKTIYNADENKLKKTISSRSSDYAKLCNKDTEKASSIIEFCKKHNVGIVAFTDSDFPQRLREIPTPPVLLYYRGELPDLDNEYCLGIVGTRTLSYYGRKNTYNTAYDMARSGAIIVSGMATGIDGVAHAGALAAGGKTVAVLGSGINICYPPCHLNLARAIVNNGCVITEYPPDTRPEKYNFPRRNRIISGLSHSVAVMEGTERSGALHTARYANKQGRPVFAFPGDVGNPRSELSNLLIKNGAKLFTSADQLIADSGDFGNKKLNPFLLTEDKRPDITDVLSRYSVSAVTPSDDIFKTPRAKRSTRKSVITSNDIETLAMSEASSEDMVQKVESSFDKVAIDIYKRIPTDGDCPIESLITEELSLRDIMKHLLKLEMGHFVTILPGERVQRKLK